MGKILSPGFVVTDNKKYFLGYGDKNIIKGEPGISQPGSPGIQGPDGYNGANGITGTSIICPRVVIFSADKSISLPVSDSIIGGHYIDTPNTIFSIPISSGYTTATFYIEAIAINYTIYLCSDPLDPTGSVLAGSTISSNLDTLEYSKTAFSLPSSPFTGILYLAGVENLPMTPIHLPEIHSYAIYLEWS